MTRFLRLSLTGSLLLQACALRQVHEPIQSGVARSAIESHIDQVIHLAEPLEEERIRAKITDFDRAVERDWRERKSLRLTTWQLHDELLEAYLQLQERRRLLPGALKIHVPARSQVNVRSQSFCLNSHYAVPAAHERFQWKRGAPAIPYFREVLRYGDQHPGIPQSDLQTLLWNLENNAPYESYPARLKRILLEIDPKAPLKLPSELKEKATGYLKKWVRAVVDQTLPQAREVEEAVHALQGRYADYQEIADLIVRKTSRYGLPPADGPEPIPGTDLYADTLSDGYNYTTIDLYNPTDHDAEIDLSRYYLQPRRPDVQRIGLLPGRFGASEDRLVGALESSLYQHLARLGIGFLPGVNDVADAYELLAGRDFVSGQKLGFWDRALSGLGLLAGSGAGYRYAKRWIGSPDTFRGLFQKGFQSVSGGRPLESITGDSLRVLRAAERMAGAVRKSPTLQRIYESPSFKKTAFYVRPNGEVIPAKGYRYLAADAEKINDILRTGEIPGRPPARPNYITFNDYPSTTEAKRALQLERLPRYKVKFETGQVSDSLDIPNARWGKVDYLEPIAESHPEYGKGGATQAITTNSIKATEIIDLETGQTVYRAPSVKGGN